MKLFQRLKEGLTKTRQGFVEKIELILTGGRLDDNFFEELEDILVSGDIGINTTLNLVDNLRQQVIKEKINDQSMIKEALKDNIIKILGEGKQDIKLRDNSPTIILVLGVNGVGKTTTIAKLAHRYKNVEKRNVLLAAGDTFRAAAIEQLEEWANRIGVDVIKHQTGADPSAVFFDTVKAGIARKMDVVIGDTAGRLHTKSNLMEELKKIYRVIGRTLPEAPHEVLLVIDATTGQNGITQARLFHEAIPLTGLVLTKLDGTAKGGIVVAVSDILGLPVKLIGIGEKLEDLYPFDPCQYVEALFG